MTCLTICGLARSIIGNRAARRPLGTGGRLGARSATMLDGTGRHSGKFRDGLRRGGGFFGG